LETDINDNQSVTLNE